MAVPGAAIVSRRNSDCHSRGAIGIVPRGSSFAEVAQQATRSAGVLCIVTCVLDMIVLHVAT